MSHSSQHRHPPSIVAGAKIFPVGDNNAEAKRPHLNLGSRVPQPFVGTESGHRVERTRDRRIGRWWPRVQRAARARRADDRRHQRPPVPQPRHLAGLRDVAVGFDHPRIPRAPRHQ